MSFKRRDNSAARELQPGVRPSASNGVPVTSSGCQSLDSVLSGHGGIPLGSILLLEENGTTDFTSVLLRYFAAEGLNQGHCVWVGGGIGDSWFKDLPLSTGNTAEEIASDKMLDERMKIAWRYSNLGEFGTTQRQSTAPAASTEPNKKPYCHAYDLTKRAVLEPDAKTASSSGCAQSGDPFAPILASLVERLKQTNGVIRCVIPGLLSPALYPPSASHTKYVIKFINNLRVLTRLHASRLITMISIPLDLYPRKSQTTTWTEILVDGIIELQPLPPSMADRDGPQGLLRIHKVPGLERVVSEADLSFKVSRKRFTIEAWSLPALGEEQPREGGGTLKDVKPTNIDIAF